VNILAHEVIWLDASDQSDYISETSDEISSSSLRIKGPLTVSQSKPVNHTQQIRTSDKVGIRVTVKKTILLSCMIICLAAFLGSAMLRIYVSAVNPNPLHHWPYVPLGGGVHVAVIKRWGSNLVFYNGDLPYLGDVISIDDGKNINERGWNGFGTYLRLIKNADVGVTWWTFMINLWYPIIIFGILSAICVAKNLYGPRPC
jgi:hypothetical protein